MINKTILFDEAPLLAVRHQPGQYKPKDIRLKSNLYISPEYHLETLKFPQALPTNHPEKTYIIRGNQEITFNSEFYTKITTPDQRTIYIALEHNAAYLFAKEDKANGIISGNEELIHCDYPSHSDMGDFIPGNTFFSFFEDNGITIENYLSALKQLFPTMNLTFLQGIGKADTYELADKLSFNTIQSLAHAYTPQQEKYIMSVDIDLFDAIATNQVKSTEVLDRLATLAKKAIATYIVLSPDYIGKNTGCYYISELLRRIL